MYPSGFNFLYYNLKNNDREFVNIYSILNKRDVLITDYSVFNSNCKYDLNACIQFNISKLVNKDFIKWFIYKLNTFDVVSVIEINN